MKVEDIEGTVLGILGGGFGEPLVGGALLLITIGALGFCGAPLLIPGTIVCGTPKELEDPMEPTDPTGDINRPETGGDWESEVCGSCGAWCVGCTDACCTG